MLERRCWAVAHAFARRLGLRVSHRGPGIAWPGVGLAVTLVGAALVTVSTAGCDAGLYPASDPQSVIRAYARDLEDGRADAAYRLLSDEARRGISLEAFRRMVSDDPEGVREIGRSLERPTAVPVVTAIVTSPSGQELNLALEDGHWRIDGSAIDLYAADTPRRAIEGFVRAVERKRFDIVMHYVPETHREGLDAATLQAAWEGPEKDEIAQVIAGLKQALPGAAIEESGERATMAYGAGTLQLVREHGLWKIENFD
jgi:hypothetical protein